ncbi:isoleucine--tRNA ligase [Rhizomicrobium electricum]|uniref:Isoleucine--tRNA ligase n=1 Tax=Rhizomicrobium electricum TaxID=480070 RepID=A0ABN1EKY6_9PROT|nr:isoleucine--tRNA ligase [Rhizomicrobium electricum]NIJ47076.1 isoleucyl-tRNA synthetase [Rhizomicrobium electricum]
MSKDSDQTGAKDYRATLFLPQTDFPMKAGLPQAEPKWLAKWEAEDLYGRIRAAAKGRPQFILHDGPPYANGEIHSGTGLNKILKDFVIRSQTMMGKDAPYVPGWDCHGLPIEWKIEEKYRASGKSKDSVPIDQLRKDCREFALKWIDVQRGQFKRMGVMAEWAHPYTTMNFAAEATIAGELHKFVDVGLLYRGFRPVMWSPVEKTALAEAEIEYHEKTSPTIYVKFPVVRAGLLKDRPEKSLSVVIWTTTPWTIPGNRAICYSPKMTYSLFEVVDASEGALASKGELLFLSDALADQTASHAKIEIKCVAEVDPSTIHCAHPFRELDPYYGFDVPLLAGEHVTDDTGTGFVHTAPGHGEDDFEIVLKNDPNYPAKHPDAFRVITADGAFAPEVPVFAGKYILSRDGKKEGDANGAVIKQLIESGKLLAKGSLRHQYPHSWRSKAPVIFRATPQWFAAMDKPFRAGKTLRQLAMEGLAATRFYPAAGANRIGSMVEGRPDWVLSRQRAWGVPLAIFVVKATGEILNDKAVNARILEAFKAEGADAWFNSPASRFLGEGKNPDDYEQVKDILDVWFDSGSTHVFTVEQPVDSHWPQADQADLYLEGSDQHRGWFQSSLLEGCATKGHPPYKAVLTHGFVLDEKGYKMSKSIGNVVLPQTIADQNGADILRLWAASSDFTEDLRIGGEIIKANVDAYRRLRNTIRFMLANLAGFEESERIAVSEMPELERYIVAKLAEIDALVKKGYADYDFNRVFNTVFSFCTNELSAFYFDIRKDALYCDKATSVRRRASRTVTDEIFRRVVTWLAPILCFTMEEAWTLRYPNESVHLQLFAETPAEWADPALIEKWNRIRSLRRVITGALELQRKNKVIGASLEADPVLYVEDAADAALFAGLDLAEISITSGAEVATGQAPADAFRLPDVPGAATVFRAAQGDKCARCWRVLPEVGEVPEHPDLCHRCADAVG